MANHRGVRGRNHPGGCRYGKMINFRHGGSPHPVVHYFLMSRSTARPIRMNSSYTVQTSLTASLPYIERFPVQFLLTYGHRLSFAFFYTCCVAFPWFTLHHQLQDGGHLPEDRMREQRKKSLQDFKVFTIKLVHEAHNVENSFSEYTERCFLH